MLRNLPLFFFLGRPLSPFYGLIMRFREKMYNCGIFQRNSLPVPIISVGNLVLGGTGKTPTVRYLAELLSRWGYHPAVISRGYGGKAKENCNVVADSSSILLTPEFAGDEPYMLAESLPGIPVLTGRQRFYPCRRAVEAFNADVLLLDDGFQHLAVKRDIDLVLFDATVLAADERVFPGGILREPLAALSRCHAFLITGITKDNRQQAEHFGAWLYHQYERKPVFYATLDGLQLQTANRRIAEDQTLEPFFAFCGIANPSRFQNGLNALSNKPCGFLSFPDHVPYNQRMAKDICKQARACGAKVLVTTRKDFVKIQGIELSLPCYVAEMKFQIGKDFDTFLDTSLAKLKIFPPISKRYTKT